MNLKLAHSILFQLANQGVEQIAICAGARNAPFVHILEKKHPFKINSFFDERSASFFALGAAKRSGRPTVVITTSGTAVSETYSAVIEAHYTALPLVIISADRPKSYRGACAPQSIEQRDIFGVYANCYDIDSCEDAQFVIERRAVTHLNVCFDEPLLDQELAELSWPPPYSLPKALTASKSTSIERFLNDKVCPLFIVGGLSYSEGRAVAAKLESIKAPVVAESISNFPYRLRNQIVNFEKIKGGFDAIIRIGSIPTFRFWRDLESKKIPTISFSSAPFSGLSWQKDTPESVETFLQSEILFDADVSELFANDRRISECFAQLLLKYPNSEISLVKELSREVAADDDLFIGNSLPIRHWNQVSQTSARHFFNRGVNGIDGLISTALGCATKDRKMWIVLGDLSALYDLNSLAMTPDDLRDVTICVINNGGGKIFSPMFGSALFENRHKLHFFHWAEMFGWNYCKSISELKGIKGRVIVELCPDPDETTKFAEEWRLV